MYTQSAIFLFLKENVCSGYSLEAALSNVNDSFTFSRLMKRPKTFWPARDEYPQLTFFNIYRNAVSTMFKHMRHRTPTPFKCCYNHMQKFQVTVAEVVNRVDYESASYKSRYFRSTGREYMCTYTYPNSFGCIFIRVWVSAITINNYNQLAPMYTPKTQIRSNSKLRNYWSRSDKAQIKMGCDWLKRHRTWFYTTYKISVLGAYALNSLYAYMLQPPRPLRNDPWFIQYINP